MFRQIEQDVDELDIPVDCDALRDVLRIQDRLNAKVSAAIGEIDKAGLWELQGATSMTAWLRDHGRATSKVAARAAKIAKRVRDLPALHSAWEHGRLSSGQVEAVTSIVPRRHAELFAQHEADLVPTLVGLSVGDTARVMQTWVARADALDDGDPPESPPSILHASATLEDRVEVSGSLDAVGGAMFLKALQLADSPDVPGDDPRTPAERRADALVEIARFYIEFQPGNPGRRRRPNIDLIIHADGSRPAWIADTGGLIPEIDVHRFLCDGAVRRVVTDGRSVILDMGTLTRVVTTAMWLALAIRDQHCRFPGCDRPAHWCEAHHVWAWEDGGPTRLDNLVLLCSRHHHLVHKPGWTLKLVVDNNAEVIATGPDGRVYRSHPPP